MLDAIPWGAVADAGWGAIVVAVVWMILTGRLVPRSFHEQIVAQKEHWRAAAEQLRETVHVQAQTIDKQTQVGDTVVRVMRAVQDAAAEDKRSS